MRNLFLCVWIVAIYFATAGATGFILRSGAIVTSDGDISYVQDHMGWVAGIYFVVIYFMVKPLFYFLFRMQKATLSLRIVDSVIWPIFLLISTVAIIAIPITFSWQRVLENGYGSILLLWFVLACDPLVTLGRWIAESDFFQRRIDMWSSYGSLKYYVSQYPPNKPSDVMPGLIGINLICAVVVVFQLWH